MYHPLPSPPQFSTNLSLGNMPASRIPLLLSWLYSLPRYLPQLPHFVMMGLLPTPTHHNPARYTAVLQVLSQPARWLAALPNPRYWPSHSASTAPRRYPVRARAPPERYCSCFSRDAPACGCDQTMDLET